MWNQGLSLIRSSTLSVPPVASTSSTCSHNPASSVPQTLQVCESTGFPSGVDEESINGGRKRVLNSVTLYHSTRYHIPEEVTSLRKSFSVA